MLSSVFMCIIILLFHSVNKYSAPKGRSGTGDMGMNETVIIPVLWEFTIRNWAVEEVITKGNWQVV